MCTFSVSKMHDQHKNVIKKKLFQSFGEDRRGDDTGVRYQLVQPALQVRSKHVLFYGGLIIEGLKPDL